MQANTIKIEDPLLGQVYKIKPKDVNFSAFVRGLLEKEVKRQQMIRAADEYSRWLAVQEEEASEMADWENADLGSVPKVRKAKK